MRGLRGAALAVIALAVFRQAQGNDIPPLYRVHTFYYLWYSEPSTGGWTHWDHEVLSHWDPVVAKKFPEGVRFEPPNCIHSPFYPLRGPYSSASSELIRQHLQEMEQHGIGVMVASWWGPPWRRSSHDTQLVNTDLRVEQVIREIEQTGSRVRIAFHLEPYEGRTKETVHEDLVYLGNKYQDSRAVLRFNGRPVYYVYDSYRLPPTDWAQLLRANDGPLSVRGTAADGYFLGLWLDKDDGDEDILPAGFEGFYTYFSSEQVSYGGNPTNWPLMQKWASDNGLLFVPSIGPGYNDGKIRPWNLAATRSRDDGERYRAMWGAVLAMDVQVVSITSYNEWGEGTQIEPAVPREPHLDCQYLSYEPNSPFLYLEVTKVAAEKLGQQASAVHKGTPGSAKGRKGRSAASSQGDNEGGGEKGGDDASCPASSDESGK